MAETRLCPECGLELRPDASPEELCPRCLLAAGTGGADYAEILESLVGRTVDGKYRVERPLGRGGMGAVYLATHLGTERPVALKVLAPHLVDDEEFVERFRREARAAGRLRHPNIVNVTDFGFADLAEEGVIAYLVMEYLDGMSLAEYLARGYERPLPWVADVVEQIALAVDEAHSHGVIHRDLKPENIWLVPDGRGGHHVKVVDFGLAKLRVVDSGELAPVATATESELPTLPMPARPPAPRARGFGAWRSAARITGLARGALTLAGNPPSEAAGITRVGTVIGTPRYMSPEQCQGERLDGRSDVYSLGVVAYELLTGLLPFKGDTATLIAQHIERAPSPVSLMCDRLPESVDEAVMPALAKTPAERPASAGVFAAGLTAALQTCGERAESILGQAVAIYGSRPWTFLAISPFTGFAPVGAFVSVLVLALGARVGGVRSVAGLLAVVVVALLVNGLNAAFVVPAVARLLERPDGPALSMPSPRLLRRIPLVLLSAFLPWDESPRFRLEVFCLGVMIAGLSATREQGWYAAGFLFLACAVVLLWLVGVRPQLGSSVLLLEGRTLRESARRARALAKRFNAVYDVGGGGGEVAVTVLFVGLVGSALAVASLALTAGGALIDGQIAAVLIAVPVVAALVLNPILSIVFALRYLKARKLGGESLDDLAGPVDDSADPYTWMQSPLDAETLRVQPDWTRLAAAAGATLLGFSALSFVIAVSAFHLLALAPLAAGMWLATRVIYRRTGLVVTDELVSQPSLFVGRRSVRWDDVHWSWVTRATAEIQGTGVGLVRLRLRDYRNGCELSDYIAHQLRRRQKAFLRSAYWRW